MGGLPQYDNKSKLLYSAPKFNDIPNNVALLKKGYKLQPPIGYICSGSETPSYLHHYFAYINGKFILVR